MDIYELNAKSPTYRRWGRCIRNKTAKFNDLIAENSIVAQVQNRQISPLESPETTRFWRKTAAFRTFRQDFRSESLKMFTRPSINGTETTVGRLVSIFTRRIFMKSPISRLLIGSVMAAAIGGIVLTGCQQSPTGAGPVAGNNSKTNTSSGTSDPANQANAATTPTSETDSVGANLVLVSLDVPNMT